LKTRLKKKLLSLSSLKMRLVFGIARKASGKTRGGNKIPRE
jgi:hypothetical protein